MAGLASVFYLFLVFTLFWSIMDQVYTILAITQKNRIYSVKNIESIMIILDCAQKKKTTTFAHLFPRYPRLIKNLMELHKIDEVTHFWIAYYTSAIFV